MRRLIPRGLLPAAAFVALSILISAPPARAGLPQRGVRLFGDPGRAAPFAPTLLPSTSGSPVECVILTPDSLADVFQKLADYQTRSGRPTVVRGLSTVRAADPRSNDMAQAIRSFLKSARDLWGIRWAVLGADHAAIPLRTVRVNFAIPEDIPTDVYYSDLDGTWDRNGNGIYGEVADSLDMEPDIAVGRLSAGTRAEAAVLVNKAIHYASTPDTAAVGKQLILAEVLFPSNWHPGLGVQQDGATDAESLRVHMPACSAVDPYYENYTQYPGSSPLTKASALSALSRGYNVVYHVGHGARSQLSVGSETLTLDDLASFQNGDSAALWIVSNCASAAVDFDCVAERLVRRPNGGALAYVGATRDSWPGAASKLNRRIQDQLFTLPSAAPGRTLGEAIEDARAALLPEARTETQERWSYFETVLLGLPSLPIWRCPPPTFAVTRPATVPLSSSSFAVTVLSKGAPVESALVVAWKAGEDYSAALTNAAGQATLPFHPATTGAFSFSVTARDVRPYLDSLTVTAAAPAHFAALGTGLSDALHGDNDGRIGTGEAFGLTGVVKNTGQTASAGALTLEVIATTSGLVVERSIANVGALAAGAQLTIPDSLRVRALAAPNAPRIERLRLIARDASRRDTSEIDVGVTAAALLLSRATSADTDGDGILEPGEDATYTWVVGNEGDGRARTPTVTALNPAPGISLTTAAGTSPSIAPGGVATTTSIVAHATSVPAGRLFDVRITDAYGHAWTFPVERTAPPVPTNLKVAGSTTDAITIEWSAAPAPDLLGFVVLRAATDTTAAPVEAATLPVRRTPSYENTGLSPLTRYWFAVQSVDSSGNRSARSPYMLASTTPPALAGWPAPLQAASSASITFGDLDNDGGMEVIAGADFLYVFHADGTDWIDGDSDPVSIGVFSTLLHGLASTPAVADVNQDGIREIIAASWDDSTVAVFRPNGTVLPGWPKKGAAPFWSSPAIGDVDGDGAPDVLVGSNAAVLYGWRANGAELRDGDSNPATNGVYFVPIGTVISSPAIADVNGDGMREVIFGTSSARVYVLKNGTPLPGWPFVATGLMSSSPAVGDVVSGSPGLEIAMACANDSVYVLTASGQRAPGWPKPLELTPGNGRVPSPVLAPLRKHLGDSALDVVVCGWDGKLRAYDPTGAILPGWSAVALGAPTEATPSVVDLDGDGTLEVLVGAEDRRLYAFHFDGTPVSGFPIETGGEVRSSPAIWDVDRNGGCDVFVAGWDGMIHGWRYPGSFTSAGMAWPMFHHDNWHTGVATFPIVTSADPAPVPEPASAPGARASLAQNRPNPFNPVTAIGFTVPGPSAAPVTLRIYTVDGRLVRTLVSRNFDPGYHEVRWDGRGESGTSLGSGVYLYRATIGTKSFARKMAILR